VHAPHTDSSAAAQVRCTARARDLRLPAARTGARTVELLSSIFSGLLQRLECVAPVFLPGARERKQSGRDEGGESDLFDGH
jgi:hypothetical protein